MTRQELATYHQLISEFEELPEVSTPDPTILEIAGYPHYEEVISNILRFFFRSDRDHGLSGIFVESLLSAAGKADELDPEDLIVTGVDREVTTHSGKRIDLLIKTEASTIAIENKIFAKLYNDLPDYQEFVKSAFPGKENLVLIVLSLRELEKPVHNEKDDFILVTYREFFNKLEQRLGKAVPRISSKHLIYLSDFITTIRNLDTMTNLEPEHIDFLKENKDKIEDLYKLAYKTFKDELEKLANDIDSQLENNKLGFSSFHLPKTDQLEYVQGYKKIIEHNSQEFELQVKLRLKPGTVTFELWSAEVAANELFHRYIKNNLNEKNLNKSPHSSNELNYTYGEPDIDMNEIDKRELVKKVSNLLEKLG